MTAGAQPSPDGTILTGTTQVTHRSERGSFSDVPTISRARSLPPLRVLVAEDNPTLERLLSALLKRWGYEPISVRSGDEAWVRLQAADGPRLALLDWMMPGLAGVDVCRRVRARQRTGYVYIVILTSKADSQDVVEALEAGADDYITKPFQPLELRARLRAARRILELEEELEHRAYYDLLTDLPNRALLADRFQHAMEEARRRSEMLAFFYIDLDGFKLVNDGLGHAAGDELLKVLAKRLATCARKSDTLARVGGDEFVLLASGLTSSAAASDISAKLLAVLNQPVEMNGQIIHPEASVGISMFPQDGADFGVLQQQADAAMYESKRRQRNGVQFSSPQIMSGHNDRFQVHTQMRGALERSEFSLEYQPIYGLRDGRMNGAEALLRWDNPVLGRVPPATFIPIAEETGQITEIGTWVLQQAHAGGRKWEKHHGKALRIAINLSASQFDKHLIATMTDVIRRTGANRVQFAVELTESMLIRDFDQSVRTIKGLHDLGVMVAIDDFGVGYSSFNYLQKLPVDALKIDMSFIQEIGRNPRCVPVIHAITRLAHDLGIRVVAEGIEDAAQLETLRMLGCDEVQGFFLGRPESGLLDLSRAVHGAAMQSWWVESPPDDIPDFLCARRLHRG